MSNSNKNTNNNGKKTNNDNKTKSKKQNQKNTINNLKDISNNDNLVTIIPIDLSNNNNNNDKKLDESNLMINKPIYISCFKKNNKNLFTLFDKYIIDMVEIMNNSCESNEPDKLDNTILLKSTLHMYFPYGLTSSSNKPSLSVISLIGLIFFSASSAICQSCNFVGSIVTPQIQILI